jgi:Rieske Fe-S protein
VLLGAGLAGLGGLGGALAGCSTAAVPYDANEAGVADGAEQPAGRPIPAPSTMVMPSAAPAGRKPRTTRINGTVLAAAAEIPVGGGKIFAAERVVVTQPTRGTYRGFSAVCTHVGCILSTVSDGTIDCPCHGSEFKITNGAVVTGPAPAPLPKKQIKIVDGKVMLL